MIFRDDIPSIQIDNFKDHYVLVFDLNSMQDATENYHYLELVGEPLKLELNFTFPLKHITELIVFVGTNVFRCGRQVWRCWKKQFKWIMLLSSK